MLDGEVKQKTASYTATSPLILALKRLSLRAPLLFSVNFIKITIALVLSLVILDTPSTQAVELADGRVSFEKSPRLLDAVTTFNQADVRGATYYFTVDLPGDIGEPLQRLTINQRQGGYKIQFYPEKSSAFEGTYQDRGQPLSLGRVTKDDSTKTISVTFDPPVNPGKTITVGLRPVRNPRWGGVYLFGVTAFPPGENPYGLYLGVGRLQFYSPAGDRLNFR
ncbi:MAG: DUF2808 domain-containing protein [Moorea sp. SIO1F2]|nr:DUF2808 domain-containing protein [Moorena sp. SIO3I7]NEO07754.1 DUF2808 domain-containing protein [Moorena sp. SIO3I8]NEO23923.1 DUF2808 domain-containing protein [Moorena sp. SIO4A5]NEP24649.1 DUF2808 domain-containing protein [Moorena sp. SIO3I6]NEQ58908.1 DUF2808 domain-containing protein [Moorena sp. SIO4A1]NET85424.1 DUF2808 domain-containing protein [Moorena sp. SIO1F2]